MAIDYRDFNSSGAPKVSIDNQWWKLSDLEAAQSVSGILEFLNKHQVERFTQDSLSARLYGNVSVMGLGTVTNVKVASTRSTASDRITYNVIQSAVDTVTAKMSKNKPKAFFLTEGGKYKMQRRARKLQKFVDGIFYENKAYEEGPLVFRDGCVLGDGFTHVFECEGRVRHERVFKHELYVDEVEAFYGKPRQLHRVKNVDRMVVAALFPEKKKQIMRAKRCETSRTGGYENISDLITVRESWHLPSGKDAGDGKRLMSLENGTLDGWDYEKPFFPFARFQWCPRMYGYWAQGLAEQLQGIQLEINKLLWVIQRSMHLAGSFKIFLENGSKIAKQFFNNEIGTIIPYTGVEPKYITPPIVPAEIYQHLLNLKNSAFEIAGVSQLSAASQKPAGLNSGKALREYNDIESDRFTTVGQNYENYFLQLAALDVSVAKDIYEREGEYKVTTPEKGFTSTIDWKEIDLDEDEYFMKLYPVSALPDNPSEKFQEVQERMQAGLLPPRIGRRLLDLPDLEAEDNLENAKEEVIHKIMDKILDADVDDKDALEAAYTPPEPYDDLDLALELSLEYYAQAKNNGVEEEKLDLIRQYCDQVKALQAAANPPPPMGPQGPGGGMSPPQAVPQPPPQSDMIPNVPGAAA